MNDDHERATCALAGSFGHFMCGTCTDHGRPRFECGCAVYEVTSTDGLGQKIPSRVSLAMVFDNASINVGPRNVATKRWLEELGGLMYCNASITELGNRWLGRGITRRDLPRMASELQAAIQDRYDNRARGHQWHHPPLRVDVRACEYVAPAPTHLELREI